MTTLYDVPAEDLIEAVAEDIADELDQPDWVEIGRASCRERVCLYV